MPPRVVTALALVAGSVAVTLFALEIALRFTATTVIDRNAPTLAGITLERNATALKYSTPRGKRVRPDANVLVKRHRISGRDVAIETNALGYRHGPVAIPKPPGTFRVLVLGDSITFGGYLPADEVYVAFIETPLRARMGDRPVEVINAGVGDIGIREEVDILEETGLGTSPDVVVVGFYLNDSRPPQGFPDELGAPGWLRRHSVLAETVYQRLKLHQWLTASGASRFEWIPFVETLDWRQRPSAFAELASRARYDWGAAWEPESWTAVARDLDRLATLARTHDFDVLLAAFPVVFQVYAGFLEETPQRRLATLAATRGFGFVDVLPALRARAAATPAAPLFYDQCHPGPEANRLYGELIGRAIVEQILSRPSRAAP